MRTKDFVTRVNKSKSNLDLVDIFDEVELDARREERKNTLQMIRNMLWGHSGKNWGHYNADTAVTEYRAYFIKQIDEMIETRCKICNKLIKDDDARDCCDKCLKESK